MRLFVPQPEAAKDILEASYQHGRFKSIAASTFLRLIGMDSQDSRLGVLRNEKFSVLHLVADAVGRIPAFSSGTPEELQLWLNIACTAMKHSLDPHQIAETDQTTVVSKTPATPLFSLVVEIFEISHDHGKKAMLVIRSWLIAVRESGHDIFQYGMREDLCWKLHQLQTPYCRYPGVTRPVYFRFTYGRDPEQWSISVQESFCIPLFKLEPMPGSFGISRYLPQYLCWYPYERGHPFEKNVGPYTWSISRQVHLESAS